MAVNIAGIAPGSPAAKAGLRPGMTLHRINGEEILDFIDLAWFESLPEWEAEISLKGRVKTVSLRKGEALSGLEPAEDAYPPEKRCANRCLFCFVDQMPPGMRPSLYGKDDDWRYSLLFGNYVTLTNMTEGDFARLIRRQVSPINISVHTTDPGLRARLMGNPRAAKLGEQLRRLAEGGIAFHCQIVLCPGLNDGEQLSRTLDDLYALAPAALSAAVVPVGVTKFRKGLEPMRRPDRAEAADAVGRIQRAAERATAETGHRFAFGSDELYQLAGLPWPRYPDGCHTPQLGNGVGLLHDFLSGAEAALGELPAALKSPREVWMVTGAAMYDTLSSLARQTEARAGGFTARVIKADNRYFGEEITVAGLLTARDMLAALPPGRADLLLLPPTCLRQGEDVFLDDMTLREFAEKAGMPVTAAPGDGYDLVYAMIGETAE